MMYLNYIHLAEDLNIKFVSENGAIRHEKDDMVFGHIGADKICD
jgi:hypothetical protein